MSKKKKKKIKYLFQLFVETLSLPIWETKAKSFEKIPKQVLHCCSYTDSLATSTDKCQH